MILLAHVGGPVFEPLQVAGLTLVATAYSLRMLTLSREGRPVPGWRIACFASGLALIAIAFIDAFLLVDLSKFIALLFIAAMVALISSLVVFLREIFLAVTSARNTIHLKEKIQARLESASRARSAPDAIE